MSNPNNNDVFPASLTAFCLIAIAVGTSTLVAKQPERTPSQQSQEDPIVNNADVTDPDVVAPIYGLTLEQRDKPDPYIAAVEAGSPPWKAGLREGDYLLAFGEVRDLPFDDFLEGVQQVAKETFEGDDIKIRYRRDGRVHDTKMKGVGRTPKSLRKLQARSEKAIEEKLKPDESEMATGQQQEVSTEQLEEYLDLQRRYDTGELSSDERGRYDELATVVFGGGGLLGTGLGGGFYGGGGNQAAVGGGNPQVTGPRGQLTREGGANQPGQAGSTLGNGQQVPETGIGAEGGNRATPGSGIGDPSSQATGQQGANGQSNGVPLNTQLGQQMLQLQQMQQQGMQLNPQQSRRLAALQQLSNSSTALPRGSSQAMTQPLQAELSQLQQAAQGGQLTPAQRQRFSQLKQMQQAAISQPGANRNLPNRNLPNNANGAVNGGAANQAPNALNGAAGATGAAGAAGSAGASNAAGAAGGASSAAGAGSSIGKGAN